MAFATTLPFSKIRLLVENPATPGTFVKICGLNERSLSYTKELNSVVTPDCDNDDAPASTEYDVASDGWTVSGNGVLTAEGYPIAEAFRAAGVAWNIRYEEDFPAPLGLKTYSGKAFLQSLEVNASRGTRGTMTFTLQGSGPLTVT
jgi:hypothetical protein